MGMRYTITKADRLVRSLSGRPRHRLEEICEGIQQAEETLVAHAQPHFEACMRHCNGLCCRNIYVDQIITPLDIVYIRVLAPDRIGPLMVRAEKQGLFSADCIFLENGVGPCSFGMNLKPERCIITFCSDTDAIRQEIRAVQRGFGKLQRFLMLHCPVRWFFYL
jgi:hypothetical protein